jgi:hypothetical protein
VVSRHARGAAVGEEDAQPDHRAQHDRGRCQATQLGGAEVTDDRRVGEQHQRLGDEGEEGRDGDRQDLSIGVAAQLHAGLSKVTTG